MPPEGEGEGEANNHYNKQSISLLLVKRLSRGMIITYKGEWDRESLYYIN